FCCFIAFIAARLVTQTSAQNQSCTTYPPDVQSRTVSWAKGSNVTININSNDFSPTDRDCLQVVIDNYNAVAASNGSGVHFNLTYDSQAIALERFNDPFGEDRTAFPSQSGATNVFQVNRPANDPSFDSSSSENAVHLGRTSNGTEGGDNRIAAVTNIRPEITDCASLQQV